MERIFIKKISNKKAKEMFKGEKAVKVQYGDKILNLIGDVCSKKFEEVIFCSYATQKALQYGAIISDEFIVNDNISGSFVICK